MPEHAAADMALLKSPEKGIFVLQTNKMKLIYTTLLLLCMIDAKAQQSYLLVGTYDSPKSEGIYVYTFNSSDGTAKEISHVKIPNASFLTVSPDQKYVYAVSETGDSTGKGGKACSFAFNKKTGTLKQLSQQSSGGSRPCYITIDKTGKWVLAANYASGNFSILPAKNGILGKPKKTVQFSGSGPDTARQKSPHAHGIFMKKDNTGFFVTDLGTDKVMKYRFDAKTGNISPEKIPFVQISPGSGPRHMDLHPKLPVMYVLNELSGSIDVLKPWGAGDVAVVQSIPSFPLYYRGPAASADIHVSPDGRFLYCSNRGALHNIGIFSIDSASGHLTALADQPALGERPRNFNFDPSGKFLLVGNQASDEIVIFKRDIKTGLLTDTGNRISVGRPVCIKWVTGNQ